MMWAVFADGIKVGVVFKKSWNLVTECGTIVTTKYKLFGKTNKEDGIK